MKNLFLPYEIALLLKQKGFNEQCLGSYNPTHGLIIGDEFFTNNIPAPIHQQALDWLLDKHNLDIHAHKMWHYSYNYEEKRMETFYQVSVCDFTIDREERDAQDDRIYVKYVYICSNTELKTYKEAIEDGITWALKHIN